MSKARMEAFSDGVFAIAITLLVIELPIGEGDTALEKVLDAWPFYLAYLVSFLTIGAAWLAHNGVTERLQRVDGILMRLNLLLLLFVSLLPFPTRLVAESMHDLTDERIFVPMYGLTLMAIRIMLYSVDEYAHRENFYDAAEAARRKDAVRRTILPVVGVYLGSIAVGFFFPSVAVGLYCALALYLVVPFRHLHDLLSHHPPQEE